ncbi:hypothetical protein FGO68_gene13474 [Halteria grandinella]|uniref:Uncharacterized protein n=1 Tax=Halteria grandinella TaxID=5974 RepID=A0A8J8NAV4_HALGN|nr:hypothetical protein FGO68_gene13474 [Halteria grandinella]
MKVESLVIANQQVAVNTFPGLVHTARHTMGVDCTRSGQANRKEAAPQGVVHDWGEVVTRQPQGNLRLDHLLSKESAKSQDLVHSQVMPTSQYHPWTRADELTSVCIQFSGTEESVL